MGQEIADQHDRCAGGGSEAHGGAVFAGEIGAEPRDRGGLDRHGAEQEAKRVDVMDQYLHHQHPLLRLEERLSRERRPHPIGLWQEGRGQGRHAALMHAPDGAVIEPGLELAIVRPETPVLVHHQPRAGAGEACQGFGLDERRRQRLLAQDRNAAFGRKPDDLRVHLARRRHVERVECNCVHHRARVAEGRADAEGGRTLRRLCRARIGNRDNLGARPLRLPGQEMVVTDHTGAGETDLPAHGCVIPQRRWCEWTCAQAAGPRRWLGRCRDRTGRARRGRRRAAPGSRSRRFRARGTWP